MIFGERSAEGVGIDASYRYISEAPAYQDPDGETVAVVDDTPVGQETTEGSPSLESHPPRTSTDRPPETTGRRGQRDQPHA